MGQIIRYGVLDLICISLVEAYMSPKRSPTQAVNTVAQYESDCKTLLEEPVPAKHTTGLHSFDHLSWSPSCLESLAQTAGLPGDTLGTWGHQR